MPIPELVLRFFTQIRDPALEEGVADGAPYGPADDDPFIAGLDPAAMDIAGLAVTIDYIDALNQPSRRTIRCERGGLGHGKAYIVAWCRLRAAWRSFAIDNIVAVYDYSTGVPLGSGRLFFGPFFESLPDPRPFLAYYAGYHALRDSVRALIFLGLADGKLSHEERRVAAGYAIARVERENPGRFLTRDPSALAWVSCQVPDRSQALAGLRHTFDEPGEAPFLADALFAMMLADGAASDEEMALMNAFTASMARREKRNLGLGAAAVETIRRRRAGLYEEG